MHQVRCHCRVVNPQSEAARKLGKRVKDARVALGLSQIQVWQISGIHFTNIGKIERGTANPALHTIVRLADALNLEASELVAGITAADLPEKEQELLLPRSARGDSSRRKHDPGQKRKTSR